MIYVRKRKGIGVKILASSKPDTYPITGCEAKGRRGTVRLIEVRSFIW